MCSTPSRRKLLAGFEAGSERVATPSRHWLCSHPWIRSCSNTGSPVFSARKTSDTRRCAARDAARCSRSGGLCPQPRQLHSSNHARPAHRVNTVFLYPGQGAQTPHFLRTLLAHQAAREAVGEASEVLDTDVTRIDDEAALESTVAVQLGILVAGVAYTRMLAAENIYPDAVAGLSVGTFTAAVACGALRFDDALRLVRLRGEAMASACGEGGYGMVAVLGLREITVRSVIKSIADPALPLYLASVITPTQFVLAGSKAALSAATREAQRLGGRPQPLRVSVPSHCPLMANVSTLLRRAMRDVNFAQSRVPYLSNHRARALREGREIAEDLILSVSQTVRWYESIALLYELGARLFVEAPPGRTLSNSIKSEFPQARALAAEDSSLDSICHFAGLATP